MPERSEKPWSTAALRVASANLDGEDISRLIGLSPTKSIRRGTPVSVSRPTSALHRESVWILESGLDDEQPLERHVVILTDILGQYRTGFESALAGGCYVDLVCAFSSGSGQGGFALEAKVLRRLSEIPVGLVVDLFPPAQSPGGLQKAAH